MTALFVVTNPAVVAHADKGGQANSGGGNANGGGQGTSGGHSNGGGSGNSGGNAKGSSGGNAKAVGGQNSNAGGNGQGDTASSVATTNSIVSVASGGTVSAGSITINVPSGALAGLTDTVNVSVKPASNVSVPGGPVQFSPNGTLADIAISDSHGAPVSTFPAPISLALKYNAADLAMARGDAKLLSVAFVVDAKTPPLENPLGFPVGTFVLASNVAVDVPNGQVVVQTQALGSIVAVVANPVTYVQTLQPGTAIYSSFDPAAGVILGTKPQFRTLQLAEPQIGSRLLVLDPDSGNYAYVDAASVGPSGPPSKAGPAGVTRGLLEGAGS